jgi:hypothetical protein
VTNDFGLWFAVELSRRFGWSGADWPASAEQVTPFFAIIIDALGAADAARWLEAARKAHQRSVAAEKTGTHNFGFAQYLDTETGAHKEPTLPVVAAFEATKALYEITRRDKDADVDEFFDCALQACARASGQASSTPVAAGATA